MPLRLRRGTDAERLAITPAAGEPIYTTDTKKLYIGDGTTVGGIEVTSEETGSGNGGIVDVVSDTSPQLGGNLDLFGKNIVGTGNINIDGTITATGNINLGDSTEDSVNLAGLLNSNITPATTELYNIGSDTLTWNNIYGTNIIGDLKGSVVSNDSTVLVNSATKDMIARDIIATGSISGLLDGDVQGSVLASDSTVILDYTTKDISGRNITASENFIGIFEGDLEGSVIADDGTILIDSSTKNIFGTFDGDFFGSLLADDSSAIINAISRSAILTSLETDEITSPTDLEIRPDSSFRLKVYQSDATDVMMQILGVTTGDVNSGGAPIFNITSRRGTELSPIPINQGDAVGQISFAGYIGQSEAGKRLVNIAASAGDNADFDTLFPEAQLVIYLGDNDDTGDSANLRVWEFNPSGSLKSDILQVRPADADRRAQITPEAGMIVYNAEIDKFQGYVQDTGSGTPGWVDLH